MTWRRLVAGPLTIWLLAACCAHAAVAQGVSDPTRPPAAALLDTGPAGIAAVPAGPVLQSVLISLRPSGRRVAVISGQTVRQGERFGDAVLVRMTSTEVVLRRGRELQTLKLSTTPDADAGGKRAAGTLFNNKDQ
jgi:MSHA biogenesis protein MshK